MIITRQENIKIIIITILIFLGSVVGLSYAYFSTQVEGNDEASSMTITTASLRLVYQDSQFIELNDAYPGNYVDKEVKVTNFSSIAVTFDMFFVDMVNTIINDELVISYTCTSYENYGEVTEAVVGICDGLEEQGITDNPAIEEAITIGPGLTNVYNIRIEFKEMGINQSYNLNTNFRGKINISESEDAFTLVLQVLDEDGDPIEGALGEVHSRVRSGITNSSGIARISNVTQGDHNLIVKESPNGEEVLSTPITIEAVPVASTALINGTTITGQKGKEEIAVRVQEVNNDITFVPLTDMVSLEINLNGGTIDQRFYSSYLLGEELELVEPEKVGYQFTGWEVTGTGASVNKNTLIIGTETAVTAMWTPTTYNITYNYDGGSGSNPANYNIESNSITLSVPQKTGYTFAGWTGSNGESPQMSVTISSGSTGDKTYTANWIPNTYTITYDYDGGSGSNPASYNIESNSITLSTPNAKTGYTFAGWTGSNGTTPQMSVTISSGSIGDKTYIANWTPNTYTITYNYNGGSGNNPASYNIESNSIILTAPSTIPTGYAFVGWTGSNGTTPQMSVTISSGSIGDKSYTANYTEVYDITYDLAGGNMTGQINGYTVISSTITLPTPTKTGSVFIGWTGSNGTTPQMSVTIPSGSTGDKSYTANWRYYLFNAGDVRMGGFTQSVNSTSMSWNISYNGSTISWSSSGQGWGVMKKIASNNAIDLTGFTKLVVHLTSYSGSSGGGDFGPYVGMCINNNVATSNHSATGIGGHISTGTMSDYELTYTFSNVTSSYYFCTGFYVNHFGNYYSYSMSMVIDQVWLE